MAARRTIRLYLRDVFSGCCRTELSPRARFFYNEIKNAPTGAGQWAHSAGRCDERLADSVVHHGAKEILLLIKRAGMDVFRPVIVDSAHLADDLRFKAQQVCDRAEALASHGVAARDLDVVNPIIVKSSMMPVVSQFES